MITQDQLITAACAEAEDFLDHHEKGYKGPMTRRKTQLLLKQINGILERVAKQYERIGKRNKERLVPLGEPVQHQLDRHRRCMDDLRRTKFEIKNGGLAPTKWETILLD